MRSSAKLARMPPSRWFVARTGRRGRWSRRQRPTVREIAGMARLQSFSPHSTPVARSRLGARRCRRALQHEPLGGSVCDHGLRWCTWPGRGASHHMTCSFAPAEHKCRCSIKRQIQQDVKLAFAAPAVSSGLRRSRVLLTARHHRYHPARYMKDPPQVHPGSVRGRRKLARTGQPEAGLFVAGRCILQPSTDQASVACCPARSAQKRYPNISSVLTTAADPNGHAQARPSTCQSSSRNLTGSSPRTGGHRNRGASGSVNRPPPLLRPERSAQMRHRAGSTIGGRHPLYVRAQLETAGLI